MQILTGLFELGLSLKQPLCQQAVDAILRPNQLADCSFELLELLALLGLGLLKRQIERQLFDPAEIGGSVQNLRQKQRRYAELDLPQQ